MSGLRNKHVSDYSPYSTTPPPSKYRSCNQILFNSSHSCCDNTFRRYHQCLTYRSMRHLHNYSPLPSYHSYFGLITKIRSRPPTHLTTRSTSRLKYKHGPYLSYLTKTSPPRYSYSTSTWPLSLNNYFRHHFHPYRRLRRTKPNTTP